MNVNNKCQNLQVKNSKSKNSSKEVNASGERQYKTTYKAIKKYFKVINEGMFDANYHHLTKLKSRTCETKMCRSSQHIGVEEKRY